MRTLEELKKKLTAEEAKKMGLAFELQCQNEIVADLKKEIWLMENKVQIGDDIDFIDGKKVVRCQITDLKVKYDRIEPVIIAYKKDGTLGVRTLYYGWNPAWEKVPKPIAKQ